jgi:hypothetical protein
MAVISFMDAKEFDPTKAYFNKLKSKEEVCYLVLTNYGNEEINETVKAVIVNDDITEMRHGVVYIKMLDYTNEEKELSEFLEEHVDPTDIYTYVVKLGENYNDLRVLTQMVSRYSDNKLRFIGGNLLALEGAGVGFFSDAFIANNKLKTKPLVRFDFTQVRCINSRDLVVRDLSEYHARKTQPKKSAVRKARTNAKPRSGANQAKRTNKKRSMVDILSAY